MNIANKYQLTNLSKSLSKWIIWTFVFIGIFHKFISNDIPIIARYDGRLCSPVVEDYLYDFRFIKDNPHLKKSKYVSIIGPLIGSPYDTDVSQVYLSPGKQGHILGTDSVGRDVLAGLVYGASTALKVSFYGVMLALIIGLIIGMTSGYYHSRNPDIDLVKGVIVSIIILLAACYFIIELMSGGTSFFVLQTIIIVSALTIYAICMFIPDLIKRRMVVPLAPIADKLIEVREAIPSIFLILGALALFPQSSDWNVVIIIGLISWSNISRYIRSEVLKIRSNHYIDAAKVQGLSNFRIMFRHILPNAIDPILAVITFGFTTAILLEATLSFLGIGMPPEQPTWGGMLAMARDANIWWLAFFPGLSIFLIISCLNVLADNYQKKLERRM